MSLPAEIEMTFFVLALINLKKKCLSNISNHTSSQVKRNKFNKQHTHTATLRAL